MLQTSDIGFLVLIKKIDLLIYPLFALSFLLSSIFCFESAVFGVLSSKFCLVLFIFFFVFCVLTSIFQVIIFNLYLLSSVFYSSIFCLSSTFLMSILHLSSFILSFLVFYLLRLSHWINLVASINLLLANFFITPSILYFLPYVLPINFNLLSSTFYLHSLIIKLLSFLQSQFFLLLSAYFLHSFQLLNFNFHLLATLFQFSATIF